MNKKGFTLVEIIVSISLVSVVMIFLFQIITTIKNIYDKQNNKNDIKINSNDDGIVTGVVYREKWLGEWLNARWTYYIK